MQKQYSESVVSALLSADENGVIRIPPGSACEIEDLTKGLMELEKMVYLTRVEGVGYFRPFVLTKEGATLKRCLMISECVTA